MREAIESSHGQSLISNMAILSPQAPFRCTIPHITTGCQRNIVKEFELAYQTICLAKLRDPEEDLRGQLLREDCSAQTRDQILKLKWADLFFQSTVINETDYFMTCEYTTNGELPDAKTRHTKAIGYIESQVKKLLQFLQQNFGMLGMEDGLLLEKNLVIVPESPYAKDPLSSVFVIALPCHMVTQAVQDAVVQSWISFDLRLGESFEIGGWANHKSAYEINHFYQLPAIVKDKYRERFLGTPTFSDKFVLESVAHQQTDDRQTMDLFD